MNDIERFAKEMIEAVWEQALDENAGGVWRGMIDEALK